MANRPKRFYADQEWAIFFGIIAILVVIVLTAVGGSYMLYKALTSPRPTNTTPTAATAPVAERRNIPGEIRTYDSPDVYDAYVFDTNPPQYGLVLKTEDASRTRDVWATYVQESDEWVDARECVMIPLAPGNQPSMDCREIKLSDPDRLRLTIARANDLLHNPPKK